MVLTSHCSCFVRNILKTNESVIFSKCVVYKIIKEKTLYSPYYLPDDSICFRKQQLLFIASSVSLITLTAVVQVI